MIGTVEIKTRPLRLAHLVDPNNAAQVREAIRLSSTLWGGTYFPIIPLYKRIPATWAERPFKSPRAADVILGFLKAFDPDILVQFSNDVPSFIKGIGLRMIKPEDVWNTLDEGNVLSPNFGIGILELLDEIFDKNFRYIPRYPLRVVIPTTPGKLSLFWASWLGEIPRRIMTLIEERYFEPLDIQSISFTVDKLGDVMAPNVIFPRRIAQYALKPFKRSPFSREVYVYFLDATALGDVIDFWNLRALGRSVMPVPKQLQDDGQLREVVLNYLKAHRQPGRFFVDVIRARTVTKEEVQGYVQRLKTSYGSADSSNDPIFGIHERYPRIWDEWARGKGSSAEPLDLYGDIEQSIEVTEPRIRFLNQLPEFADRRGVHVEPRCANEIEYRLFGNDHYSAEAFPKPVGRNLRWAISGDSFSEWRVGRNGLVKLVEGHFSATLDIPPAERIFFAWLTDLGWKPQLSPPGRLAKEIYKRLQGNPSVLKNNTLLDLLERMNGGKVKQEIRAVDVEQEKELSVGEVKNKLKTSSEGRNLHDYLISRGVFKLGSKVQCPNCLRNTWFSLDSLADNLTCPKCLNSFPAIGNVDSPDWSYKTTGPFSVPRYAEGSYAVLLTLQLLGGNKTLTLRTTPVLSFNATGQDGKKIEADFAMLWQQESIRGDKGEGLLFGECKTYGVFKKRDVDRMRYLAEIFPGAVLVFSTLRPSLNPDEIRIITRLAKIGRKYWKLERPINPVMILTGTELLNSMRPPRCWEQAVQTKFDQTGGLVGLCDITQQIYLNLPSWHTEWHENWKKRRQRLQARKNS